ncbi:GDP-mannose 4,6-dehydratase [Sulfitobacter sp. JL08]|uniref:GDP-mannose 4,6-dehydratase n=1 Tax=Sulfitobacter sp. JL08 TaxID=2070369 RepID=UPI000E0AAD01|nr:GDP-mannose 4,6-dehydratase [Sulfitobacter sp. JL08]AXI54118.1 GDP-mannose 4,6-dehydratase [Sulfitobacter sp. JL08]
MSQKTALICGISGQDGAYLAQLLLQRGYRVVGTSRDASNNRFSNLHALGISDQVETISMSHVDFRSVAQAIKTAEPDEVYNLAGQSSVGLSFQQPVETLDSIAVGTINLLEALRFTNSSARIYQASSSECFGNTEGQAADEDTPFHPRSPYATAKAAAHWTVANYRDAYGLHACSGILFNHESPLRPERFVTRKIICGVVRIARDGGGELHLGALSIARDWGWAPEYVEAMWRMLQSDTPRDYVIATGQSHSLRDFCHAAFAELDLEMENHVVSDASLLRPSEISVSTGNPDRATRELGWTAKTDMAGVIQKLIAAERTIPS